MTASLTPSLRGICSASHFRPGTKLWYTKSKLTVDMFPEGNRIHKIKSRHQAARKFLQYSTPDSAIEDSNPVFGKGCEVRSTLA